MTKCKLGLGAFGLSALYIAAIKPRIFNRPDYTPFFHKYYAHRGLHNMSPLLRDNGSDYYCKDGCFPENSYLAIQRAVEAGYGVEFDVHLTKDLIPVVFHDDTLLRLCGVDDYLRNYTYAELQKFHLYDTDQTIPKFEDILHMVGGRVPLVIEYKVENNANLLCKICNDLLMEYEGPYCIESFHPSAVHWYKKNRPDIVRGQLSEDFTKEKFTFPLFLLSHLVGNFYGSPDFISYNCKHYKELSRTLCKHLYKSLSVAWTVRSQKELNIVRKHFDSYIFENFIPEN